MCASPQASRATKCGIWLAGAVAFLLLGLHSSLSHAQVSSTITPTTGGGSLGTQLNTVGNTRQITGGTRPGNGAILFHSFDQFTVGQGDIAQFLNTTPLLQTSNILGRVTGGNVSNIFGTIDTMSYSGANLWLMNPAGFLFGPNATLHIGGTATFTSASYLGLLDGARFSADPGPSDALLSAAPVATFGFLGSDPGSITVQGSQLKVGVGQGLTLVGGTLTIGSGRQGEGAVQPANISAPAGRIHLASVASPGEILAGTLDRPPNANRQSLGPLGTIHLSQRSFIDASGDGGGTILIRGGRLVLDDAKMSSNITGPALSEPGRGIDIAVTEDAIIANGALLETTVSGNATPGVQYGGVSVKAHRIEILGSTETEEFMGVQSNVGGASRGGNSGNITLDANSIVIRDAGTETTLVEALTEGVGNGGQIRLKANSTIVIDGGIVSTETIEGSGSAGDIQLSSAQGSILLSNNARVTSQANDSEGNAGSLRISAPNGDIILNNRVQLFNQTFEAGALGGIQVIATNLTLTDSVIAGDNFSPVAPGDIAVTLSGSLSLRSTSDPTFLQTVSRGSAPAANLDILARDIRVAGASFLSTETTGAGSGGRLNIHTDNLQLLDGGQIRSGSVLGRNPLTRAAVLPSGAGGSIRVQGVAGERTRTVMVSGTDSGFSTQAQGTGVGGTVHISAESLSLENGGTISASTTGTAASAVGGNVAVDATEFVRLEGGASISANSTGPANAGSIFLNAGQQFVALNSSVTTEASKASGGNITIIAQDQVRLINSKITASVQGDATTTGGNIAIDPNHVVLQNSSITATAQAGQGGNITITTANLLQNNSRIDASSAFGVNGTVTIQSPTSNLAATWARAKQSYQEAASLLKQRCAAQVGGEHSSFVLAGREGVPAEPGAWLASPLLGEFEAVRWSAIDDLTVARTFAAPQDTVSVRRGASPGPLLSVIPFDWNEGCGS